MIESWLNSYGRRYFWYNSIIGSNRLSFNLRKLTNRQDWCVESNGSHRIPNWVVLLYNQKELNFY